MRDYTKIEAWRLADDLTVSVYEHTQSFPKEEIYGLTSQIRRAAYSVPANIVEGALRGSKKDYLHFLYSSRGSLAETQYFVHLARRLNYLPAEKAEALAKQTKLAFACLHGLIQAVEKEAGRLSKLVATATSLIAIGLMRWSGSQSSVAS